MAWFWTDALAELLVEHDLVPPTRVADWLERPVAYRLAEDGEPLELARRLLTPEPAPGQAAGPFLAA
ncbi:MAG TPA: hypothetical protein VMX37_00845 [Acidimicrobiia bacterium]|nr:hypothetical protein [Acidimicrobiia bacterium]